MVRRSGALALTIVLAALPSLSRICLTGCDLEKSAVARIDRTSDELTTQPPPGGDLPCPLHDSQAAPPEHSSGPDRSSRPSPCQHQQELANADYAKSRGLVLDTHTSAGVVTVATIADPVWAATGASISDRLSISRRPPSHTFVLRI